MLDNTNIPLNRAIPNPHATRSVVFRVTVKDDDEPTTALAQDARQQIKNAKGNSFELYVKSVRGPAKVEKPDAPAKDEFLKSCYYLDCDDARVKKLAAEAVGDETDPLKKARRVEGWVCDHMDKDNQAAFVPAGQIAKDPEGRLPPARPAGGGDVPGGGRALAHGGRTGVRADKPRQVR